MPRSGPSHADQELAESVSTAERPVTARQIDRWRAHGLLPANLRRGRGRGRGSTSVPGPGARELAVWLADHAGRGRRPSDLALLAFAAGLPVPEATVRAAFTDAVRGVQLPVEREMPASAGPEAIADAAVEAGLRRTMVPQRIRRIDAALAGMGVDWASPGLAVHDPGSSSTPATGSDWALAAVQAILGGGAAVDMGMIGTLLRTLMPTGAAAPIAGQIEYGWPIGLDEVPAALLTDDGSVPYLPSGDLREHMADLTASISLNELREAWQIAVQIPEWAVGLCAAVEREIAAGMLGEAAEEWYMGAFGIPRLLLTNALDRKPGPASTATSALGLILDRNMIRILRQYLPTDNFQLLSNPVVLPPFLAPFMGS